MRIRTFVTFLWTFVMLVFAGFGSYYLVTGENAITGQSRNISSPEVLNASDINNVATSEPKTDEVSVELSENDLKLQQFTDASKYATIPIELTATQGGLASIILKYGVDPETDFLYTTVVSSGLPKDQIFNVWLVNSDEDTYNLGVLESYDDSDVHRLATSNEISIDDYSTVAVTLDDELAEDQTEYTYVSDFVVYEGEIPTNNETSSEETPTPEPTL